MSRTPEVLRRTGGRNMKSIVFDEETIAARVAELGAEITEAYPEGELLVLGLLKGSFIFLSDLVRKVERPLQVDFLVASSYGAGTVVNYQWDRDYSPYGSTPGYTGAATMITARDDDPQIAAEGSARQLPRS